MVASILSQKTVVYKYTAPSSHNKISPSSDKDGRSHFLFFFSFSCLSRFFSALILSLSPWRRNRRYTRYTEGKKKIIFNIHSWETLFSLQYEK